MNATRTCSIAGCGRRFAAHDLCLMHYKRKQRNGDPLKLVKQAGGPCAVEGCDRVYEAKGFCKLHYRRWMSHGDPLTVLPTGGWTGDDATYLAFHVRQRKVRGLAENHLCGCGARADEWAYDHADPDERQQTIGKYTMPYSLDMDHYSPMCHSCHRRFDKAYKQLKADK
jgi:hypothetical protein